MDTNWSGKEDGDIDPLQEDYEIILSILFKKSRFPTLEQAISWMKEHGYPVYSHHEFKTAWAVHTREEVDHGKERSKLLEEGVMAIIGLLES